MAFNGSDSRPTRSTKPTAMKVASTLTTPMAYSVALACSSGVVNPAFAKISLA